MSDQQDPFPPEIPITITDCTAAFAGLSQYLDGALGRPQQDSMKAHIDSCPPCLDAFQFQTGFRSMLQNGLRNDPPDGLRDRVFGQILNDPFNTDSGPGL